MNWPSYPTARSRHLLIAGIGASAGGLEAMLVLFAYLRPTGRIAYVVAQHMAKDGHDQLVVRLLNRNSALPVILAQQGQSLAADTIYVIPSGKDGMINGSILTLHAPLTGNLSVPSVNILFTSIAESMHNDAIGIVLSGTGYDGVTGCRALREQGGMTIAQAPDEAKFNGMPNAAIEARLIEKVLRVENIAAFLTEKYPGTAITPSRNTSNLPSIPIQKPEQGNDELAVLLPLVLQATGIDFSSYKDETLLRRLEKRKNMLGISSSEAYLSIVRRQPEELKVLQHLFLVSVSSFFRDREAFRELELKLAGLISTKPMDEGINIWVPGCASGEEVYTLAILLEELLGADRSRHPVRILGSDLNPEALDMARTGIYRQTALREMEKTYRERYFTPKGQHFEVCQTLRDMVEFEQRDVLSGAPAHLTGHLDLVSCRNLLIYMKSTLQDRLISSFHQALRPQGLLFIGQSEALGLVGNSLFGSLDHYYRLYRRRH